MTSTRNLSELEKLEYYRIALTNAKNRATINQAFIEIGFSNEMLDEGINLYTLAAKAYQNANRAGKKREVAYMLYNRKVKELEEQFRIDRKLAKITFLNDPLAKSELDLGSRLIQGRMKQFEQAKIFYTNLSNLPELLDTVFKLDDTDKVINKRFEILSETEKAKSEYFMANKNAVNATKVKKDSMKALSRWMTQFMSLAKNALKDTPDMLVALGQKG